MENKLYIGGISYSTTQDGLKDFFSQAGNVTSATIIMDRETGKSKGFGFVEMASEQEAQAAIEMLDGKELDGRTLKVMIARPKEDRPRGGGFRGGNGGGRGFGGGNRQDW